MMIYLYECSHIYGKIWFSKFKRNGFIERPSNLNLYDAQAYCKFAFLLIGPKGCEALIHLKGSLSKHALFICCISVLLHY